MQFGLGQQTSGGKFDWTHVHRHMTGRWPALSPGQTTKYAELVMAQLSEPASDKLYFTDGISKKDILQHYELNKVPYAVNQCNMNASIFGQALHELRPRLTRRPAWFIPGPSYKLTNPAMRTCQSCISKQDWSVLTVGIVR